MQMGEFLAIIVFLCIAIAVFGSLVIFMVALPVFIVFAIIGLMFSIVGLLFKFVFGGPLLLIVIIASIIYFSKR